MHKLSFSINLIHSFLKLFFLLTDLHIPEFLGRYAVLFFKRPEKTGIVLKPKHQVGLADADAAQYGILTGCLPFLGNILMDGYPDGLFKHMGNIILAYIKFSCQVLQGQILLQMFIDILNDTFFQIFIFLPSPGMVSFIYHAVQMQEQVADADGDLGIPAEVF